MVNVKLRQYFAERGYSERVIEGGLRYLLDRWRSLVERLPRGYDRGIDEYRDDLDCRSIIEEAMPWLEPTERAAVATETEALDEQFRSATSPSAVPAMRTAADGQWWLYRFPPGLSLPRAAKSR